MNIKIVWHNYYITFFAVCKYISQIFNQLLWKIEKSYFRDGRGTQ